MFAHHLTDIARFDGSADMPERIPFCPSSRTTVSLTLVLSDVVRSSRRAKARRYRGGGFAHRGKVTRGDRFTGSYECYRAFDLISKLSNISSGQSNPARSKLHHLGIETIYLFMLPLCRFSQQMPGQNRNILTSLA